MTAECIPKILLLSSSNDATSSTVELIEPVEVRSHSPGSVHFLQGPEWQRKLRYDIIKTVTLNGGTILHQPHHDVQLLLISYPRQGAVSEASTWTFPFR